MTLRTLTKPMLQLSAVFCLTGAAWTLAAETPAGPLVPLAADGE